jgi:hypothetical protein
MRLTTWIVPAAMALLSQPLAALPTTVTVRAISRDAKVIGSGVGGARITIRDVASGKVLAEGIQEGGTGETKAIMGEPHARNGEPYSGESAASFVASIDLSEPTVVEIIAAGPLKYPQAVQKASKTMLLVPGQHVTGEGILLEIHGFIIDIRQSEPERVVMKMNMACGCPIQPGGMWDADKIAIAASLWRGAEKVAEVPVKYAGEVSMFEASFADVAPGTYRLRVLASDAVNENFGMATTEVVVRERGTKR